MTPEKKPNVVMRGKSDRVMKESFQVVKSALSDTIDKLHQQSAHVLEHLADVDGDVHRSSDLRQTLISGGEDGSDGGDDCDSTAEQDRAFLTGQGHHKSSSHHHSHSRSKEGHFEIVHQSEEDDKEEHEEELFGLNDESALYDQLRVLMQQSIPVIISFFLSVGGSFTNLVFAGHYVHETGDRAAVFAGVSLANMFANVSCLSILIGMSGAVETLGSQHNGAGNYKEVGIILQRSILILSVITVPIAILWFFADDIFRSIHVEETVCDVIRQFIRIRALTIPMDVFNESYEKYLMSIGVMKPSMWANVAFNFFIFLFDVIFVYGFQLHYQCLAWSWVLSLYLSAFVQVWMSLPEPAVQRTLVPFDKSAFLKWKEFIDLGLPGTVMLCSEWWAYEILSIFASMLGTAQVAAQTIILQTASLAFMVPLGLGVACASLVGNAMGAGKKPLAISIGKLSVKSIFALEVLIGVIIFFLGPFFIDLFTDDERVRQVGNRAIPFLSLFALIDGLQGVCSGVLRGAGKQFVGAVANVIAFYVIGLPMAWFFCFTLELGVNGLMLGISCGTVFQVFVLVVMIFFFESYVYSSEFAMSSQKSNSSNSGFKPLKTSDEDEDEMGIALQEMSSERPKATITVDDQV